jgi:hypothetical protein
MAFWAVHGYGTWACICQRRRDLPGDRRPDGTAGRAGIALRFALWPQVRGRAMRGKRRGQRWNSAMPPVSRASSRVARETNVASRAVLGDLGMQECGGFPHNGHAMKIYESLR